MRDVLSSIFNTLFPPSRPSSAPSNPTNPAYSVGRWPDDGVLFNITQVDGITRRDLMEGVSVMGQIGSGKTSGSGNLILSSLLADGWGGMITTAKPGEADSIKALCRRCGREQDIIHVRPGGEHFFNWFEWAQSRPGAGAGISVNTAETLTTLTSFLQPEQARHESENAHFFKENATRWLTYALMLIALAGATPSVDLIADIIASMPDPRSDAEEPHHRRSALWFLLEEAAKRALTLQQRDEYQRVEAFWTQEVFMGSDRALGDIGLTLSTSLFRLRQDPIRDLVAANDGCSFAPEEAGHGRILLVDAPTMVYQSAGRFITRTHKYLFQQAMSGREPITADTRPVFLFCDEAQSYLSPGDADYQALCRDRRAATVYLSQNLDNYVAVTGSRERAEQLLANLTLKIWHANSGPTNEWASRQIADAWQNVAGHNFSNRGEGQHSFSSSISPQTKAQVMPSEFTRLRAGGATAQRCVDAIVFKASRVFRLSGQPYVRTTFVQGEL